jgi:uncharacterized membrane protein
VNKWNAPATKDATKADTRIVSSTPTIAIVTINFAMEGDSTVLPTITSREDVHNALSMIASDALVGGCLMTAEIIWSPEDPSESLSKEEIYADFPTLIPI